MNSKNRNFQKKDEFNDSSVIDVNEIEKVSK